MMDPFFIKERGEPFTGLHTSQNMGHVEEVERCVKI